MKNYLCAYLEQNLGDDLFVYVLCNRYNNINFYTYSRFKYKNLMNSCKNLKVYSNIGYRLCNKFIKKISKMRSSIEHFFVKKSDCTILLGGSLFIQNDLEIPKSILEKSNNYYIIGSNFGPYNNIQYLEYYKKIFSNAKDVCFREKYTYDLFKNIKNVRMAADIIFGIKTFELQKSEEKKVIISVIDCDNKNLGQHTKLYEEKILEMIKYFNKLGYNIVLMSFCKAEGDENAINRILNSMEETENINTYFYNDNIEEALRILNSASVIVGSRFHANILGLAMGKTIIPFAYSDKTINVLKEIEFKGKIFDIRNLNDEICDNFESLDLNYKLDITKQKKNSIEHFKVLDQVFDKGR